MPRKILVDTDPALLTFGRDVDDDLALLFLLGSPEVELVGVTTTGGNTGPSRAFDDAQRLLAMAGRSDIPVVRGGDREDAARFLAQAVRQAPGELTLLTLGPLGNVAAAARLDDGFGRALNEIVIMGGRSREGLADFNFKCDPLAARAVLALEAPKVQIALDAAFPVAISARDIRHLTRLKNSVVARFAWKLRLFAGVKALQRRLRGSRSPDEASGGFHPWDVVAAAWLVDPSLFGELRRIRIDVDSKGRTRFPPAHDNGFEVRVPGALDASRFRKAFFEAVAAVPSRLVV